EAFDRVERVEPAGAAIGQETTERRKCAGTVAAGQRQRAKKPRGIFEAPVFSQVLQHLGVGLLARLKMAEAFEEPLIAEIGGKTRAMGPPWPRCYRVLQTAGERSLRVAAQPVRFSLRGSAPGEQMQQFGA